ncbi:hypothetical protein GCM10027258_38970 [Amycolatopsis stemonae]
MTGKDVGTPIIHFEPPDEVAFFGPVISRLPDKAQAAQLWDHVVGPVPRLRGAEAQPARAPAVAVLRRHGAEPGATDDWHAGSSRFGK